MFEEKLNNTLEKLAGLLSRLEKRDALVSDEDEDLHVEPAVLAERDDLAQDMVQQLQDLGPISPLLQDDTVNDILINGHDEIYVERAGKLEKTSITMSSDAEVLKLAKKIAETVGRKLDSRRPLVDARLLDGSRVNIVAPPLAVDSTTISIRKFAKKAITLDNMVEQQNISDSLAEIFRIAAGSRMNIMISGGTGAGKTTLLNAISDSIGGDERIVTIEDSAELKLAQPHVIRMETKPLDLDRGRNEEVTIRDLVKNALRMRPDRIIVGEVRGPEAFDMLQAMNTGHEGSMSTIHANHPRDALSRLENMVMMANLGIPPQAIRHQIASALNLIVQISRMRDGHRRITYITEICGMEGDVITMQDLFSFVPDGRVDKQGRMTGKYKWSGIMPRFVHRVGYWGYHERLSKALGVALPRR